MASFGYTFNLPPVGASDVAAREITATINGQDPPQVRTYNGQPTVTDEWVFQDGDQVSLTLVDIDGHNNRSPSSAAFSFNVVDDVAPPVPGAMDIATKVQKD